MKKRIGGGVKKLLCSPNIHEKIQITAKKGRESIANT